MKRTENSNEPINVLSIGNSFSQDAQRYLHDLARQEGVKLETVNLMIGGCSLERHFRNMKGDRQDYVLEVNGHNAAGFMVSIKEALLARSWDYITLQQASHFSYKEETYWPYLKELAAYVREYCPNARILLHQTWGYESGSERILNHGFEKYEEMFAEIKKCYDKAATEIQADGMIPSGQAFLYAQQHVEKIHRDTFHASYGLGRFILALLWYKCITGNSVSQISFHDFEEEITEQEYQAALDAVENAVKK